MKLKSSLLLSILSFLSIDLIAQKPWQKIITVEDVCESYEAVYRLLEEMDEAYDSERE